MRTGVLDDVEDGVLTSVSYDALYCAMAHLQGIVWVGVGDLCRSVERQAYER